MTEKQKKEIDKLAREMPKWQQHLSEFRERHPELSPQEVMKKAGFTFRMKKGKLVSDYVKQLFKEVIEEVASKREPESSR